MPCKRGKRIRETSWRTGGVRGNSISPKKQSRPGCPGRDVFGGCPIQSTDSVSQATCRSCLLPGYQPVCPPPLPEDLRKNHLAMEDASAPPAEVCRLYSCRPSNKLPLFLTPCPLGLGIGLCASQKAFGPSAFHTVSNRRVSSRTFRPVMLAGLAGQPGSHSLAATRRSWSSPEDSAALTASLFTFSREQMKCLLDFRLVASLYDLRRIDNHPGLSASSPTLNLPSTRISLAASARRKIWSHPKVNPAGTALSFATLRRLAPVEVFDRQPHPATSACAVFDIAVFTLRTSFAFFG